MYIEGPAVDSVCYGNTVSLTCTYPNIMDMVDGRRKYLSTSSEWAVNGTRILPDGMTTSIQAVNSTAEGLDVTITREQFEAGISYYSCYLILYNGSRETSSELEIDPPGEGVYLCDVMCVVTCVKFYNFQSIMENTQNLLMCVESMYVVQR